MYDTYLLTRLASHGFVVAAPLHRDCETEGQPAGCNAEPLFNTTQQSRPADVEAVIDDLLAKSAGGDPMLAGTVDGNRIGVLGHSLGGWTSIRVLKVDPRVKAVLALAPARSGTLAGDFGSIDRPLMVLIGDADSLYTGDANNFRTIPASAPDHWFGALRGANHLIMLSMCYARQGVDAPCSRLADQSQTASSVERAGIAFLQVFVAGDARYRSWLDPRAYGPALALISVKSGAQPPALPSPGTVGP